MAYRDKKLATQAGIAAGSAWIEMSLVGLLIAGLFGSYSGYKLTCTSTLGWFGAARDPEKARRMRACEDSLVRRPAPRLPSALLL